MKVCVHYNLGPFDQHYVSAASINEAVRFFRDSLESYYGELSGILERTGEDYAPAMNLYPYCKECTDNMCFHDYPMARYTVGPRGGIRKEFV